MLMQSCLERKLKWCLQGLLPDSILNQTLGEKWVKWTWTSALRTRAWYHVASWFRRIYRISRAIWFWRKLRSFYEAAAESYSNGYGNNLWATYWWFNKCQLFIYSSWVNRVSPQMCHLQHNIMVFQFCRHIWNRWLVLALLSGKIPMTSKKKSKEEVKWIPKDLIGWIH